jgi:hypothetical protein
MNVSIDSAGRVSDLEGIAIARLAIASRTNAGGRYPEAARVVKGSKPHSRRESHGRPRRSEARCAQLDGGNGSWARCGTVTI